MQILNTSNPLDVPLAESIDFAPMTFGKHYGKTPEWVSLNDPRYLVWLWQTVRQDFCSKALYIDTRNDLGESND